MKYIIAASEYDDGGWKELTGPMDREDMLFRLSLYTQSDEDDGDYLNFKIICSED